MPALSPNDLERGESGAPIETIDPEPRARGGTPGIWQIAWPAIVSNLLFSLVGFIDTKIVGSLGAPAVAAVSTGNRIYFILQAMLMAVTAGTTALVARAWGAGDRAEAERVTKASLGLCAAISLALTVPAFVWALPLASIFRLDAETIALSADFIRWLAPFQIAFAVHFAIGAALRAAGDTMTPLWVGALTNVVNVVLCYALVYGRFGAPALGVAGAALASGIAFAIGALAFVALWVRNRLVLSVGPGGVWERARVGRILDIGYPAAVEQLVWQGGFLVFLWIVSLYGTAPYAAYGIGVTILAFSFLVGFGFQIAASTLVGQHLGADDPDGAEKSGWRALRYALAAQTTFGLVIIATAEPLARFMIDDPEVVRLTVVFIYILGSVQPLMAIESAMGGALRGAGDTRYPLFAVFSGLIGARVVLASIFAWLGWPVEWIFAALIADYVVKAFLLTRRYRTGRWKTVLAARSRGTARSVAARG
jgi:putative MATE family efflux protein